MSRKTEKQIIEEYFQSFALEECLDEVILSLLSALSLSLTILLIGFK